MEAMKIPLCFHGVQGPPAKVVEVHRKQYKVRMNNDFKSKAIYGTISIWNRFSKK